MRAVIGAVAALVLIAGGVFVAGGYLHTRRLEHAALGRHQAVHAMSMQQLAAAIERCDAVAQHLPRDADYCEEVARELDARPLEMVEVKPGGAPAQPSRR